MSSEFDLIQHYFSRPVPDSHLGGGDDCALFPVPPGHELATSTDMLLEGRHFFADVSPSALGHKALAVNLSDLAAMGATPLGCVLAIGVSSVDHDWLAAFSDAFYALANASGCPLVGGDTTRSPQGVVINVTVFGHVRRVTALQRRAAQVGDDIWLTGQLGAADIALRILDGRLPDNPDLLAATRQDLEIPQPPWGFGAALPGVAHAAIDVSDGLVQDLNHILQASRCGADLYYDALPIHAALQTLDSDIQRQAVLGGGDVYQLCFTAAPRQRRHLQRLASQWGIQLSRIGRTGSTPGLRIFDAHGAPIALAASGFDHFRG